MKDGIPMYLLCGTLAGINALLICNPFDVMRTVQITNKGDKMGLFSCIRFIFTRHGILGFYKGLNANIWRVAGWNAINFTIYQKIENDYKEYKHKKN